MKKIIVAVIVAIIIISGIYLSINPAKDIDNVLANYETYESDGYYDNINDQEADGYIVSNKTEEGYRYGYVNYKGEILLEPEYNHVHRVLETNNKNKVYLIASKDGRYGVTLNGKVIIDYEYQFIDYNSQIEGFILQKTDNYGVASIKGNIIIPVDNELVEVKGKYIYVSNSDENKVYNKNGKEEKIDFYTSINPTENENYFIKIVEVGEHYLYGIVDKDEKEIIKPSYSYIEYLFDDYFIISNKEGKEGIIDSNNSTKLEFDFTLVQKIQNTNIIRTLNNETQETELYSNNFEKICTMKSASIETEGDTIKIYNQAETKYFDKNGIEIRK